MKTRSLAFLFSSALLSLPMEAQDQTSAAAAAPFVLEAGELKLQDLVEQAGDYLDFNILIDARECTQAMPIKLDRRIATDREGCIDVVTSLLYRSGFAMMPLEAEHGIYEVVLTTGSRGREVTSRAVRKSAEAVLAQPNRYVPVLTTVQLKHINAQTASTSLRPFFASFSHSSGGNQLSMGSVGDASSLLLCGWQPQVAQALRVLAECDQPSRSDPAKESMGKRMKELEARIKKLEKQLASLLEHK